MRSSGRHGFAAEDPPFGLIDHAPAQGGEMLDLLAASLQPDRPQRLGHLCCAGTGGHHREISQLGPLRPGSISRQYNVCGNPTCRCKADSSQRHGPYYQLSYTHRKRSSTQFVREQELAEIELELENYQGLRALVEEWVGLGLQRARLLRQARDTSKSSRKTPKTRAVRAATP